jgi:hypothetical protein
LTVIKQHLIVSHSNMSIATYYSVAYHPNFKQRRNVCTVVGHHNNNYEI